jgi:hypothetical protein
MRRIGLLTLVGLLVAAAPADASISGSFHLPQTVIGCRWTADGTAMGLAATHGAIRCERYAAGTQ